jgi:hypothetical protein
MAKEELSKIVLAEIDLGTVKPGDKINAVKQLALIEGWNVAEKHEHDVRGLGDRIDRAFASAKQIEVATARENDLLRAERQTSTAPHERFAERSKGVLAAGIGDSPRPA